MHAEANAIFNAARRGIQTKGAKIYTTKFPCASCAGAIVQAGIRAVITRDTEIWKKDPTGDDGRRSLRILIEAGVAVHAPEIEIGELPKVIEARTNGFPRKTKRAKQG